MVVALCVACWPAGPAAQAGVDALPGEWVSTRRPAEVFTAARETLLGLGFRLRRDDARSGLLVTNRRDFDAAWPDGAALDLSAAQTPDAATVYVRVAPGFHPARLVVGAVVETATVFVPFRLPIARGRQTMYRQERFADFVAGRIGERLGETLQTLSADPAVRTQQSRPIEGDAACDGVPPLTPATQVTSPRLLQEVRPTYPPNELQRLVGGTVGLIAEVTEHGTVTAIQWRYGVEERNLVAAAIGAAGLWRFDPARDGGCPVRSTVALELAFIVAR